MNAFLSQRVRIVLLLATIVLSNVVTQAAQRMIIPAYFYPGPLWNQAIAGTPIVTTMIMNPDSGPGLAPSSSYGNAVANAQLAGVEILGYVHTSYGTRPLAEVQAEIDAYLTWYAVNGIFLDETSSGTQDLPYYQTISNYIRRSAGPVVMMNPGVYPDPAYANLADVLLVFENSFDKYRYAIVPGWATTLPAEKFLHVVFGAGSINKMRLAVRWSRQRNAGNVYITNDVLDNPYDTLPSYWSSELSELAK